MSTFPDTLPTQPVDAVSGELHDSWLDEPPTRPRIPRIERRSKPRKGTRVVVPRKALLMLALLVVLLATLAVMSGGLR